MANINSIITYNANLSPAQAQIKALTTQIGGLTAAFNTLDKSALSAQKSLAGAFAANVGQIGGFTAQTLKAHTAVENFGKQLVANKLSMREYFREAIAGYTRQNSLMKQLAVQQVRYQQSVAVSTGAGQAMMLTPQSISAMGSSAAVAAQKFAIFNKLIDGGATAMLNWGKNTQWAGRQLMVGFTLPLALFVATTSKAFRDLDIELTRFQKVYGSDLGGAVEESTLRMRENVKQLAFDMAAAYGVAAKETAALAADIAATGKEGEVLMDSVRQTTRLAVLGEVDRQDAMKTTLSLQSAFRMNTDELANSINFLNAVENQTSATLDDLATAIPKVGPVVRALGGDIKDLSTLLVAMREGGIPAAEAANALKAGLSALINPTQRANEVAAEFGINLKGIVDANRGELMPTIYAMQEALNSLDSFSRSRVIEQIFGRYQFARITALFDNIGRVGSQTESVVELASKSTAELAAVANGEIRTLTESTSVKFTRALEEIKNALMPIGQTLTETIIPIFDVIGKGVKAFSSFFQMLPEPVKNFAKYGLAITALAGPVIMLVGLFGNLIANGLRFGQMLMRIGARIGGLKVEKFELLNSEVMAAKLGIDTLNSAFITQETALNKLNTALATYAISLRKLTQTNPALFIPGAIPTARGAGVMPIKRQSGSSSPEFVPGSGRGDKIPAMLEPGEFIVNRKATQKYAPVLMQMNRGNLPGFAQGGSPSGHISLTGGRGTAYSPYTMFAPGNTPSGFGMSKSFFESSALFEKSLRASAITAVSIEKSIRLTQNNLDMLSIQTGPITQEITDALRLTAQEMQDAGQDVTHISQVMEQARPKVDRIMSSISDPQIASAMQKLMYPTAAQAVSGGNVRSPAVVIDPVTKQIVRATQYSNRTGAAASFQSKLPAAATFMGVPTSGGWTRAHLDTQKISLSGIPLGGGVMGASAEIQAIAKKALAEYTAAIARAALDGVQAGTTQVLKNNSPSKAAKAAFEDDGRDLANGAMMGLQQGYSQAAKQNLGRVPVGRTGIESISNAQKIAQADQSILRFKTLQQKATSDRVRAEVELGVLDARLLQIRNSETMTAQEKLRATLALNQERIALEKTHQTALANETRIQNIINGYKEKIASADQAQLRAEQEEARNAARRAAGSIGIGPGVGAGWLMGGRSPYASKLSVSDFNRITGGITPGPSMPISSRPTGPSAGLSSARAAAAGPRGMGMMNGMFAASMAVSSISMLGGVSEEASAKLGLFTTALMTATLLMNSGIGKGAFTNFLGLGTLGKKASVTGRAMNIAAGGASRGGAALMGLGRGLSVLGGPVGIAAGIGVTAAIAGFMMYKKAADEARERAIAAFNDPVKSAEYFGTSIMNVSNILEKNKLANVSKDISSVDQALRDAAKEDYGPLIEQIKYLSEGGGAQALSVAYSNMIVSGMSAENAKSTIEAIAAEAGIAGGKAFTEAVAQGFLDESLTIEQALTNIIGQLSPGTTAYGKSSQTIQQKLEQDIANTQKRIDEITASGYTPTSPMGGAGQTTYGVGSAAELEMLINRIGQLKDRLEDLTTINPDQISGIMDSLVMAYQQDPTAAIRGLEMLNENINNLTDEGDRNAAIDKMTEYLSNNYGEEWSLIGRTIDTANEKIVATKMLVAGISLDRAIDSAYEFNSILGETLVNAKMLADATSIELAKSEAEVTNQIIDDVDQRRAALETEIQDIENNSESAIKSYNKRKRVAQSAYEAEQEGIQAGIDAMQDEMDVRKDAYDEEMQRLDDKSKAIEKSSDAYIKSLQKGQKAESFYAQQRKTSLSALEKLASGDVFGFLQDREQMSADAQEFSYEKQIESIEDKRDLELQAIEDVQEKKRREQEEYEKMMQDRIKAEQDLMDEQQKAHDAQMEHYDKQIKKVERDSDRKVAKRRSEIGELNRIQEQHNGDIIGMQKALAEEYSKYDQYQNQIRNLEILKIKEIWYKGGVSLMMAAAQAGISGTNLLKYIQDQQFAYGSSPGTSFAGLGGMNPEDVYQGIKNPLADTGVSGAVSQQVQQMDVTANSVTINGDFGSDPNDLDGDGTPNNQDSYPSDPTRAASGGYISGPGTGTSDSIPARLSNGEYVIKASSVSKYGRGMMDAINGQRFAEGGPVEMQKSLKKWVDPSKLKFYGGWESAGSWGNGAPFGMMMHHTAKRAGQAQVDAMRSGYVWEGEFIKGPIVQSVVTADGVGHIIGYGARGTGAGPGRTEGMPSDLEEMKDALEAGGANSKLFQIEVDSDGLVKDFTAAQFDTIAKITAAIREFGKWPSFNGRIINHKDWAGYRGKTDTLYPRSLFEKNAENVWNNTDNSNTGTTNTTGNNAAPVQIASMGPIPNRGLAGVLSLLSPTMKPPSSGGGGSNSGGGNTGGGNISFKTPLPYGASLSNANKVLSAVKSSWPQNLWKVAWAIAMRESLGENLGPGMSGFNGKDYGIFQLNKPSYGSQPWWDDQKVLDPNYNANASYKYVSRSGASFLPWAMRVNNNGAGYSWDWQYYGGVPSWGRTWTMPATKAFWNSWQQRAAGGYISGPGGPRSDSIPAMLSNGEYVVKASSVNKYGRGFMDKLNSGSLEMGGYASGGLVGVGASPTFSMPSVGGNTMGITSNSYGGNSSSSRSNTNVKVVINGANNKSAKAIANQVISMINSANSRRNHSRSI